MSWLVFALRLALGGLLLLTGALKIGHAEALAAAIAGFRLVPSALVSALALALPYLELLLGLYLVLGLFTRVAGWVTCAQFAIYAAAIASAVLRHIPANCGCFGPYDRATADWPHVALDVFLAAIGVIIARAAPGAFALDRRLTR